jgi:hypothetical protein
VKQWIASAPSGEKFLVTVFLHPDTGEVVGIEVCPRTDPGHWGPPFPIEKQPEEHP